MRMCMVLELLLFIGQGLRLLIIVGSILGSDF